MLPQIADAVTVTSADIFTEAGNTVTGLLTMAGNFFTGLWGTPMGKIVCTLGIGSAAIGLGYRLFLRRKHV